MSLIVGLGNPGARYEHTRHNIGFEVAEAFAHHHGGRFRVAHDGRLAEVTIDGAQHHVLCPSTFMNRSGDSVLPVLEALGGLPPWADDATSVPALVVVHDELDIAFGALKLKRGGGSGGHNGLKSVAARLGSTDFTRLRVGIGRPAVEFDGHVADFVLARFSPEEAGRVPGLVASAVEALELLLRHGLGAAMNQVNQRLAVVAPATAPEDSNSLLHRRAEGPEVQEENS